MLPPKCENPNCTNTALKHKRKWMGFKKCCSIECSNIVKQLKMKETVLRKYGVESPTQIPGMQEKARNTVKDKYGVDNVMHLQETKDKIKETLLDRYRCTSHMHVPEIKEKVRNTTIKRYGVDNASKSEIVKNKKKLTTLKKYGVDNPFKSEEIKNKIRNTNLQKYGVTHNSYTEIGQETADFLNDNIRLSKYMINHTVIDLVNNFNISRQTAIKYLKMHNLIDLSKSYFENDIKTFLNSLNITFKERCRTVINKELDFYLPEYNLAIECNGIYWHTESSGQKTRTYHNDKTVACKEKGIDLIHLDENEWLENNNLVRSRISNKLGLSQRIFARNTTVEKITFDMAKKFTQANHIQGSCPASINYGLFNGDDLVAVMTFGKARYKKDIEYELLRYCSLLNTSIIGGASKLLNFFKKECSPESVVSYSDRRWNNGNLYNKLGFEYSHTSAPSYKYTKDYVRFENRIAYQKHKLAEKLEVFDSNLTEWENMQANGYDRIWDCGTDVWIWRNS